MTAILSPERPATRTKADSPLRVLHLVGSAESDFMASLSKLYAQDVFQPDTVAAHYAFIEPGGAWRFGPSLDRLGPELTFADALLAMPDVDLVVPHMFCPSGMTTYRALFEDMLNIKVVGSPAHVTALCTDKAKTRAVVAEAGVRVPDAIVLHKCESMSECVGDIAFPVIVKPNGADNSQGLSLVRDRADLDAAIAEAFKHDDEILIEQFIPGREIRLCVVETDTGLTVPAMMEYPMSAEHPIREAADKLDVDADGIPVSQTTRVAAKAICPASVATGLRADLREAGLRSHKALGARHYSLFDFRVHEETGEVFFLEAGLFWAFSEISMISAMLRADGRDVRTEVGKMWRRVVETVTA